MEAGGGFQIPTPEALQQHVGEEQRQDEVDDRRRIVLEAVVQGPVGAEGVEAVILDIPAIVSRLPRGGDWGVGFSRECTPQSHSELTSFSLHLASHAFAALLGLHGSQHA